VHVDEVWLEPIANDFLKIGRKPRRQR
jgi:hypothetical protein